ncbi:hypothetical protein B0T16DRAFT_460664 [Cercophora newfieldiana]|uniref:Zincin n=1 Tax=Cercophora newfieldiana TaxID=92897 RepID=A0AA40CMP8_9PEZI|nr:hypothetical protein B0T16DRAFT_460664 [Cercophora newfieldiana]
MRHMQHLAQAVCLTPACINLASYYLENLSPNFEHLDPCNPAEFEEMVCGGWRDRHELWPGGYVDVQHDRKRANRDSLLTALDGPYPPENLTIPSTPDATTLDRSNFETLKYAYNACMDTDAIADAGVQPIIDLLAELQATFPDNGMDWTDAFMITIRSEPVLGLPNHFYIYITSHGSGGNSATRANYTETLADILRRFHPRQLSAAEANTLAENLVQFEIDLAVSRRTGQLKKTHAVDKVSRRISPAIRLKKVLNSLVPEPDRHVFDKDVFADLHSLDDISQIMGDTEPETIQAYFMWRAIAATQQHVAAPGVFDRWKELRHTVVHGTGPPAERPEFCFEYINKADGLGYLSARFSLGNLVGTNEKQLANQIMDEETKSAALEKLEKMKRSKIGYPDYADITSPESLHAYYSSLSMTSSFFDNCLSLANFSVARSWAPLARPSEREWTFKPAELNGVYCRDRNAMTIPAGSLQPPFLSGDYPLAVSYGAFGSITGHEMSHGFDTRGSHYDASGRWRDWVGNDSKEEYERRKQCLVEQYWNFTVVPAERDGGPVPPGQTPFQVWGNKTAGEAFCDSAGVEVSYEAWKERQKEEEATTLPGMERFTQEQLFFVAWAGGYCSRANNSGLFYNYYMGEHPPPAVRIQGVVANSREFKEAFNCADREPVCDVW